MPVRRTFWTGGAITPQRLTDPVATVTGGQLFGLYLVVENVSPLLSGILSFDAMDWKFVLWRLIGLLFGFYCLKGGRGIQRLAYPKES